MFDVGNGCFFLHHMGLVWKCREMHGDYCGWHSVNAFFYILILKLQTKIIHVMNVIINMMKQRNRVNASFWALPSPQTQPPALESRTLHTSTSISGCLLPALSRCPKACSVNCGGCAQQLHGEVHHPISRSPSSTALVKDPPSLTVLTTYNGINWKEIQTS